MAQAQYDVVILGGGAAGLSAALYATRAMLKTLVIEKLGCGGQILITGDIDNYPGFPKGIQGPELAAAMEEQARRFDAEIVYDEVKAVEDLEKPVKKVICAEGTYTGKTVIIATGGSHRKLDVPGEEEFGGKGVSYCAVCDGNFFRDKDVVVVGGGDAAIDEGLYLTGIVKSVTVVHRRDELRASKILQDLALKNPKMKFKWSNVVKEIRGNDVVHSVLLNDLKTGKVYEHPTSAVFVYVGFVSNSDFLKDTGIELDESGHAVTNINMETSVPGVYACGDIRVDSFRQLGSAVGDGITAALAAYKFITEGPKHK